MELNCGVLQTFLFIYLFYHLTYIRNQGKLGWKGLPLFLSCCGVCLPLKEKRAAELSLKTRPEALFSYVMVQPCISQWIAWRSNHDSKPQVAVVLSSFGQLGGGLYAWGTSWVFCRIEQEEFSSCLETGEFPGKQTEDLRRQKTCINRNMQGLYLTSLNL